MKIALVEPPFSPGTREIPLGLLRLHAAIKDKHNVSIMDLNFTDEYKRLKTERFDLVGIRATSYDRDFVVRLSMKLKNNYAPIIVVGGPHPTLAPEDLLKGESIDYVIRGAGDVSFPLLIDAIDRHKSFNQIKGLCYRHNSRTHISDIAIVPDLDKLPLPSYQYIDLERYLGQNKSKVIYDSSRGCVYRCSYCSVWKMYDGRFFSAGKNKVFSDLAEILNLNKNINKIYFVDNTLNYNKERLLDICDVILSISKLTKKKINWGAMLRANNLDKKLIKIMVESGLECVFIGFETANQRSLHYLQRNENIKHMLHIINLFLKYRVITKVSFQIGLPWENAREMWKTIHLAIKLMKRGAVVALYKFTPFPGTDINIPLLKKIKKSNIRFCAMPITKHKNLTFKHPSVKDIEIRKMIEYFSKINRLLSSFKISKNKLIL